MLTTDTLLEAFHRDPVVRELDYLALADFLEEQGDSRAELLRTWLALKTKPLRSGRKRLEKKLRSFLASGMRPCVPILTNSIGMQFVLVPPGKFLMGSVPGEEGHTDDEAPQHEIEITRSFYLGVFPVTQGQYQQVMRRNPSYFRGQGKSDRRSPLVRGMDTSNFPVDNVSYSDAYRFCERLANRAAESKAGRTYRLPTEAEWEYACRAAGTTSTPFHLGSVLSSHEANFNGNEPYGGAPVGPDLERTTPVDAYPPNALGLYDMHGNVWEWCHDWYEEDYYTSSPACDPQGPDHGSGRVLRGGCWSGPGWYGRAADRGRITPSNRYRTYGFRVVMNHPGVSSGGSPSQQTEDASRRNSRAKAPRSKSR